jgi:hypothetical protein
MTSALSHLNLNAVNLKLQHISGMTRLVMTAHAQQSQQVRAVLQKMNAQFNLAKIALLLVEPIRGTPLHAKKLLAESSTQRARAVPPLEALDVSMTRPMKRVWH